MTISSLLITFVIEKDCLTTLHVSYEFTVRLMRTVRYSSTGWLIFTGNYQVDSLAQKSRKNVNVEIFSHFQVPFE